MSPRRIPLSLAVATLVVLASCSKQPPAAPARTGPRIISSVPAATMIIVQLGAIDTLVGVSKYDLPLLPPDKQSLPAVGDYESMNKELLLRLNPTAVLVYASPEKLDRSLTDLAAERHIALLNLKFDRLADLWESAAVLGKLVGRQSEAEIKIAAARAAITLVQEKAAPLDKPRVLYTVSMTNGIMIAGGGTFIDELIASAGGINVGAEVGKNYPEINREFCLRLKPDVVFLGVPGEPPQQTDDPRVERWLNMAIPAAKTRRVHVLSDPNSQLATLTIGQTVRDMAQLLHPDAFKQDPFDAPTPAATQGVEANP